MPAKKRQKTRYVGVFYVEIPRPANSGPPEKVYYIRYRKDGKLIEEPVGRHYRDGMNPLRASRIRAQRIEKQDLSNSEKRALLKAEAQKWTLERLWEAYTSDKPPTKTWRVDEGRWRLYLKPQLGHKEPKDIVPLDVDRVKHSMQKEGKSPQTIKHVIVLLQRIVNFGVKKGLCPGLSFKPQTVRVDNLKTEDLTKDQLARLLSVLDEDGGDVAQMMKLALFTGMRRGEICKLKWTDVNFDQGLIVIRNPKGGRTSMIPMNEQARRLLQARIQISEYVFPGLRGPRENVNHQARSLAERAGLPKDFRPFHGLRHTYASMLASSGQVDMYTLQKLLTHKSPQMTQRYAHLRDEALRKASHLAQQLIEDAMMTRLHSMEKAEAV